MSSNRKQKVVVYLALAALVAGDASLSFAQRREVPGGGPGGGRGNGGGNGGGRGNGGGGQPRQDRPQAPRQERPQAPRQERPQAPRQERPQAPRQDRPQQERPQQPRPDFPRQDRPQQPRQDRPQQPRQDFPRQDRPQQPRQDRPQQPRPDFPRQDRPQQDRPQQPRQDFPRQDRPGERPGDRRDDRRDDRRNDRPQQPQFPRPDRPQVPRRDVRQERQQRPDRHVERDVRRNVVTKRHVERVERVRVRHDVFRRDVRVTRVVNRYHDHYVRQYRPRYVYRQQACTTTWSTYRSHYNRWRSHGFCGGYHWNFRPVIDVHVHYYNPIVFWFYNSDWDDDYYGAWYGNDYVTYPQIRVTNSRAGVFFPTEEFIELNMAISDMSVMQQINYRTAMNDMVERLEQLFSYSSYPYGGYSPVRFDQGEVVINHFQMLPYDNAIVIEGFASNDRYQAPFKALIDLDTPYNTLVFVPNGQGEPSQQQLQELDSMNDRIVSLGGVVEYGEDDGFNFEVGFGTQNSTPYYPN